MRFQDGHGGSCAFHSKTTPKMPSADISTGTPNVEFEHAETQTQVSQETSTQTEYTPLREKQEETEEVRQNVTRFLERIGETMLKEMKKNYSCSAFDGMG